jgi:hypothetical protein
MTRTSQDTLAEEPDGGDLHVRFRGWPGRGDRPGLLNSTNARPVISSPFPRTPLPTLQTAGVAAIPIIGVCWLSQRQQLLGCRQRLSSVESGKDMIVGEGGDSTIASGTGLYKRRRIIQYLLITIVVWVGATRSNGQWRVNTS